MTDTDTYEATVERSFTARHAVAMPDGSIEASHEHQWHVTAVFRGKKLEEPMGVVVDFLAADEALASVLAELDGRNLAELPQFAAGRSSAERVAHWIARCLMEAPMLAHCLYQLKVTEAPGCTASYYP